MTNCGKAEQVVCVSCVEELRYSFVSHLSGALRRKGINDVVVDVDSDYPISKESQEKIEKARVSVMVLPGDSEPTGVCLDNFVMVRDCHRNKDQVVVPVLYGDSPLQDEWFRALDLGGFSPVHQSRKECSDSKLVEEIVRDVYETLFCMERIGIYSKLLEIEKMVSKQPLGIRRVGIWGMPGIGKTTLAKAVFDQMSSDFDACFFIEDYDKAVHEKGLYRLLEERVLKEMPGTDNTITKLSLLRDKLNSKRILVVLDDVHNALVAESFLEGFEWRGPESLIIITSRDKQVFSLCRINQVYEVQGLNEKDALQLFLLCASIKDIYEQSLHELSMEVIKYADGNPLALSIYGRELKGQRESSEMMTAFLKLKQCPPLEIVDAIKGSYDTLSNSEKNIFLDIACFFQGENVDYAMQLLEGCGFFPHVGIDVLVEKCLVTISENRVWMHNLIKNVGRGIINGETVQIERHSRLWEPLIIKYLLEHKANVEPKTTIKRTQGTEQIQGIFLDTSNLSFDVKPAAFENMLKLRLLKIYCSNPETNPVISFSKGFLHSLPNELRLLHWENYPLRSLPRNFDPRNLVEINMPHSQLKKLWGGTKNLKMLRTIKLCHSQQLADIEIVSEAQNLEVIDLQGCTRLQSFPATGQLLHLRVVNLSGCTEIKSFPEFPPNIETLHLQSTGIIELPHSIVKPNGGELLSLLAGLEGLSDALKLERITSLMKMTSAGHCGQDLGKLIFLDLKDCSRLQSLPNMVNLESLKVLDLPGCSELKTILGFPRNLKELNIAGTAVREVPQLPQSLELLYAHGCVYLESFSLDSEKLPMHYTFSDCVNLSPQVVNEFLVKSLAYVKHMPREHQQKLNKSPAFSFCAPSHTDQNSTLGLQPGASVMTRLNPSWRKMLVGFAMLVEVAFSEDLCDVTGLGISCVCRWKTAEGHSQRIERNLQCWAPGKAVPKAQKDHMFVFVDVNMRPSTDDGNDPNIWADLVVFEFFPVNKQNNRREDSCAVTRCGVRVINAATGNTSLEDISPVLSLVPMDVSSKEVEEVLRVSYDGLQEMNKLLFLYIACLVKPFIAGIDLDDGLKVLADRSLIHVSSNGEIVMHALLRRMGSSKKIERFFGKRSRSSKNSMINARKIEVTNLENPENWTKDPSYVRITFLAMAGSSTVTERLPQHQVFINFRGVELRNGFVSHLVTALESNKINVFIDNHEDRGQPIDILLKRIKESRIALVIFSGKYTESIWCMRELAMIKDCMDEGPLEVIPIFYKVLPSTVRYLKGEFGDAFRNIARIDEREEKWKKAFKAISLIMGTVLDEKSNDSDGVKKTVEDVKKVLIKIPLEGSKIASVETKENSDSPTSLSPEKDTTFGIEQHLKELEDKLDQENKLEKAWNCLMEDGAAGGAIASELLKMVIEEAKKVLSFKTVYKELASTMEQLLPIITEIESSQDVKELKTLKDTIDKALVLVRKCSAVHEWNVFLKDKYTRQVEGINTKMIKFCQIQLPLLLLRNQGLSTLKMEAINTYIQIINQLLHDLPTIHVPDFTYLCSVPKLDKVPVGLDWPLMKLKKKLFCDSLDRLLVSAPPGCGKTTLVTQLCHDADIKGKFEHIFFIVVSSSPNFKLIVQNLLQHNGKQAPTFDNDHQAVNGLRKMLEELKGKGTLLVLDDVWCTGAESFLEKFPTDIPNLKILATSRFDLPYFGYTYPLKPLKYEDAKALLLRCASQPNDASLAEYEDLLQKILKRCNGFPLVIKVVGASLKNRTLTSWKSQVISWSKGRTVLENPHPTVLDCLQPSFEALNSDLKQCFLDMGSFLEDQRIRASVITDIWSELYCESDSVMCMMFLEDLAVQNLLDLVPLGRKKHEDGFYNDFLVIQHSILRELAICLSKSEEKMERKRERLNLEIREDGFPDWCLDPMQPINARVMSISTDDLFSSSWVEMDCPNVEALVLHLSPSDYALPSFIAEMKKLKVLIIINHGFSSARLSNFSCLSSLPNLKRIRLEKVSITWLDILQLQLGSLKKLSLFMCSFGDVLYDTENIAVSTALSSLQEIDIDYCYDLEELPYWVCEVVSLKILSITNCNKISILPEAIGNLSKLEVLRLCSCINLSELPETTERLSNLQFLDISDCLRLRKLPLEIGKLKNLKKISMRKCSGCELPSSVKKLEDLEVKCDEETGFLWERLKPKMKNLTIHEETEYNLNMFQMF